MRLLPESNGVYKVNMRRKLKPFEKVKIIVASILAILAVGFLYQKIHDFAVNENLKYRYDYTRVNDKKMDYVLSGEGDYTVIFDGDIGGDLTQWMDLTKILNENAIRTFIYNRQGYGYSDSGSALSPKEQADNLKILLRKAGVGGKFILVGEGYGSLVMTNFANEYPEVVEAMILINPIDETTLASDVMKKEYRVESLRRGIEKIGSYIGVTNLLNEFNLTVDMQGYETKIPESFQEEFKAHRTMTRYNSATKNETKTLLSGTSSSQKENLLEGKPYYLITKDSNDPLKKLSTEKSTFVHETTKDSNFMALDDMKSIENALTSITKELSVRKRSSI